MGNIASSSGVLASIENVKGSAGSDYIAGNGEANDLAGRAGDDFLYGRDGNDHLKKLFKDKAISEDEEKKSLEEVQKRRSVPSTQSGRVPKLYYMTQTGTGPPEFTLFANHPNRLSVNYRRFLWLDLTDHFEFHGTPVRLKVRKSE